MHAARPIALALALLVPLVLAADPARADAPLEVDAGSSVALYAGTPAQVAGVARGGVAPLSYAWTHDGDASRFADAAAAGTTFDTTGLALGDVVLTLTVTDAAGASASDTVRHRVEASPTLLDRRLAVQAGAPDELAGVLAIDAKTAFFTVPEGTTRLDAALRWDEPTGGAYDLDFDLLRPDGTSAIGDAGRTTSHPERASVADPAPGRWTFKVEPFASGPTTAHVSVVGLSAGAMPRVDAGGPYRVGALDEPTLRAHATGGATPYAFSWDLDADGFFETPGQEIAPALAQDVHTVAVRVTDAQGYEVAAATTVEVLDSDHVLRLRCGGDPSTPFWAMEFTSTKGSCWVHGGHHTYFSPGRVYKLRALAGTAFAVEQQLSPPTETHPDDPVFDTPLHVQVSLDGLAWSDVALGHYALLPDPRSEGGLHLRQQVTFDANGLAAPFRFLRVHAPLSAAQGLAGYLDHTHLDLVVDDEGAPEAAASRVGERHLACERDILEDFFEAHPCWFGGIERYDAPSFWHTYWLGGDATLTRVSGSFLLAPWRTDDWYQGAPLGVNTTRTAAYVQVSADGVHWTNVAVVDATFGEPTRFDVALGGHAAQFVRLFPEYHNRFDETSRYAPNHHPEAYFLASDLHVVGDLPAPQATAP